MVDVFKRDAVLVGDWKFNGILEWRIVNGGDCRSLRGVYRYKFLWVGEMMIEPEIHYCKECGWNLYASFFPGNNGSIEKYWCSFCGYFGDV